MLRLIFLVLFVLLIVSAVVWLTGGDNPFAGGAQTHSVLAQKDVDVSLPKAKSEGKPPAASLLLGSNVDAGKPANRVPAVAAAAVPSLVAVRARVSEPNSPLRKIVGKMAACGMAPAAEGHGFFIDRNGTILTNFSALLNGSAWTVSTADGREYEAELLGIDAESDLALLRIDRTATAAVRWVSSPPNFAEQLLMMGLDAREGPRALGVMASSGVLENTGDDEAVTHRYYLADDAALERRPGWLLLNLDGLAAGVVSRLEKSGGARESVVITPVSVSAVVDLLKNTPVPHLTYLGLDSAPLPQSAPDDPTARGLLVTRVKDDSPFAAAGLLAGDVMVSLGGAAVGSRAQLCQLVEAMAIGAKVPLTVTRGGRTVTLHVVLREYNGGLSGLARQWFDQVARLRKNS